MFKQQRKQFNFSGNKVISTFSLRKPDPKYVSLNAFKDHPLDEVQFHISFLCHSFARWIKLKELILLSQLFSILNDDPRWASNFILWPNQPQYTRRRIFTSLTFPFISIHQISPSCCLYINRHILVLFCSATFRAALRFHLSLKSFVSFWTSTKLKCRFAKPI